MWRKKTSSAAKQSKIERRLSSLPYSDLVGWAETSLFDIGRGLHGSPEALADAEVSAEILLTAIRQMRTRRTI